MPSIDQELSPKQVVSSAPYTGRRPARPITKCDRCRKRKSKCDSSYPCGPCERAKSQCRYTEGRPTKGFQDGMMANVSHPHRSHQGSSILSLRQQRQSVISKLDTTQKLLNHLTSQKAAQAHEFKFTFENQYLSFDTGFGIDLETDNLVTHFSKLWLRKDPDPSIFQATHPFVVKVRQDQIPLWQRSRQWGTWSDYQTESRYPQLTRIDPSLLPDQEECHDLFRRFIQSCDWYFEVLTDAEGTLAEREVYHYRHLGLIPSSPGQWTRIALALAVCRLTLACLDWAGTDESEQLSRKRCERILNWCDLAVLALQKAGFDQNPTLEGMKVLIILTSTIFFETDYGLMGSSPQMLNLHHIAVEVAERLSLHRDPPSHLSTKEKDDRRRMWWSLITIDSHFYATGATSSGVLRLQNSDTKLPAPRQTQPESTYVDDNNAPLDLRSSRSRFVLGKYNNRCCQLLSQRKPLATLADIWSLDHDLVALEARVPDHQRLSNTMSPKELDRRPLAKPGSIDETLRNGQQIFYIGFWHIRSKVHRGLLYTKQTSNSSFNSLVNVDSHRDIVRRCSYCLLYLYRHTKLPTAFISAIASAALTLSLELISDPTQPYHHEIRTIVLECFSRLKTNSSPIITRACKVLEYFYPAQSPGEIPRTFLASLNEWPDFAPCMVVGEDSPEFSENGEVSNNNNNNNNNNTFALGHSEDTREDNNSLKNGAAFKGDGVHLNSSELNQDMRNLPLSNPSYSNTTTSINRQSRIGLTNIQPKVTTDCLLSNEGTSLPSQDSFLQSSYDQTFLTTGSSNFSNNLNGSMNGFENPSFQIGSSESSSYPQLLTPPQGSAAILESAPNMLSNCHDGKDSQFSTMPLAVGLPVTTKAGRHYDDCSQQILGDGGVGQGILNSLVPCGDFNLTGPFGANTNLIVAQNYRINQNPTSIGFPLSEEQSKSQ